MNMTGQIKNPNLHPEIIERSKTIKLNMGFNKIHSLVGANTHYFFLNYYFDFTYYIFFVI